MRRSRLIAVALPLAAVLALGYACFVRGGGERVAAADWFVLGPDESIVAVGSAGVLDFVDRDGKSLGPQIRFDAQGRLDVVFLRDGTAVVVDRQGGELTLREPDGALTDVGGLALAADRTLVPVLNGSRASGTIDPKAESLLLAVRGPSGVDALKSFDWRDRALSDVPLDPQVQGRVRDVSAAPDGSLLALIVARAAADRFDLVLCDARGTIRETLEDVAPVSPCWLADTRSVLYERRIGGLTRFHPADGSSAWLSDGKFPRGIARVSVGLRNLSDPFVLIEKVDLKGFVQVAKIWPFEEHGRKQFGLTTGRIHHFGLDVALDHAYYAFRRATFEPGETGVAEDVVVVRQSGAHPSRTLVSRRADPADDRIGPVFSARDHAVWLVKDGALYRHSLEGSDENGR